jgi:hypothetical protein
VNFYENIYILYCLYYRAVRLIFQNIQWLLILFMFDTPGLDGQSHSFISQSVFRVVRRLIQSYFPTKCDLVRPLSIFQYRVIFLRSSSSCLTLLYCLPVTCTFRSIIPSITCFRRQFLRKIRPVQYCKRQIPQTAVK